jgi:hypothetical protein
MSRLVRCRVQIRSAREGDMITRRIADCVYRLVGVRGPWANVRLHTGDIMLAERALDGVEMRQWFGGASDSFTRQLASAVCSWGVARGILLLRLKHS